AADQPGPDQQIDLGSETLLPGLREGLVGMEQGQTRDVQIHLPDDYHREALAGQDAVFRVTLKEIKERVLPEVDGQLARMAGAGDTLDALRQRIDERLRAAAERDA